MMEKGNIRSISEKGLAIIRGEEGLVLHVYRDPVGIWTIGYGTTHYPDGRAVTGKDPAITKAQAEQLLQFEVKAKCYVLNQSLDKFSVKLNQNQYDSICIFIYNVGVGGFLGSTLFRKLRANPNDPTIKDEFLRWDKSHKPDGTVVTLDGLTKRRAMEAQLYFTK